MRQRHPLDFSKPRVSDLPEDDKRLALLARGDRARAEWLRSRQRHPLMERLTSLLRGTPPALGEAAGASPPRAGGHSEAY